MTPEKIRNEAIGHGESYIYMYNVSLVHNNGS